MKILKNKPKNKMRQAADGGNLTLVALAVGVIILLGMYIVTKTMGDRVSSQGSNVNSALDSVNKGDLAVVGAPGGGTP